MTRAHWRKRIQLLHNAAHRTTPLSNVVINMKIQRRSVLCKRCVAEEFITIPSCSIAQLVYWPGVGSLYMDMLTQPLVTSGSSSASGGGGGVRKHKKLLRGRRGSAQTSSFRRDRSFKLRREGTTISIASSGPGGSKWHVLKRSRRQ